MFYEKKNFFERFILDVYNEFLIGFGLFHFVLKAKTKQEVQPITTLTVVYAPMWVDKTFGKSLEKNGRANCQNDYNVIQGYFSDYANSVGYVDVR